MTQAARPEHAVDAVGAVLAGGAGRRFGAARPAGGKGFLSLDGELLIVRSAGFLRRQTGGAVVVTLNPPHPPVPGDWPVISDGPWAGCGPLAGLLAALDWAAHHHPQRPWVLAVAVDTPFLPDDLMARLSVAAADGDAAIAAGGGRLHPTAGLWRTGLRVPLARALEDGIRSVRDWLQRIDCRVVPWPDPDMFANINTPADLAAARGRYRT